MINNELLSFIKERRAEGTTKEQITDMLVTHGGWDSKDVEEAFDAMEMSGTSMPSLMNAIVKEAEQVPTQKVEAKEPEIASEVAPNIITDSSVSAPFVAPAVVSPTAASAAPTFNTPAAVAPISTPSMAPKTVPPLSITPPGILRTSLPVAGAVAAPAVTLSTTPPTSSFSRPAVVASSPVSSPIQKQASNVSGMQNSSVFSMMARQGQKSLEPSIHASSIEPLRPVVESAAISPIPPSMMGASLPVNAGMPASDMPNEESLKDLRARFMEGRIVSTPVTPPVAKPNPAPVSSGGIGFPKPAFGTSPSLMGLSPHTQSGMVPSEGTPASAFISSVSAMAPAPIVQTIQPGAPIPQTMPAFGQGQKMTVTGIASLEQTRPQIRPMKAQGRKLLGFFMFTTGIVCGAIVMHAYLNGYFDPIIFKVMAIFGKTPVGS